jgi:1-acyl-sn-glycerol-3-phosphate acyltransferase
MLRDNLVKYKIPHILDRAARYYFQLEFMGEENLAPLKTGNVMFVMNHTAFFALECYLLGSRLLSTHEDLDYRTLVWQGFSEGPGKLWFQSIGCETASISLGHQRLKEGKSILIMPEGIDATDVRNRFNRFHTGYLRMLKGVDVPIIPVGFFGIDQSIPWIVAHQKKLEALLMKPVNPDFDFILFPKFPILRPTKVVFSFGEPIYPSTDKLVTEEGIREVNQKVKDNIASLVDQSEQHRKHQIQQSSLNRWFHKVVEGQITELKRR